MIISVFILLMEALETQIVWGRLKSQKDVSLSNLSPVKEYFVYLFHFPSTVLIKAHGQIISISRHKNVYANESK